MKTRFQNGVVQMHRLYKCKILKIKKISVNLCDLWAINKQRRKKNGKNEFFD